MEKQIESLFLHQKEAMLTALRRDMRSELQRVATDPEWADYHRLNPGAFKAFSKSLIRNDRKLTHPVSSRPRHNR